MTDRKARSRLRGDTATLVGSSFLAVLVAWVFREHLMGELTFPWDFQGGYFTNAVARMRDGTFVSPPLWLPWGGFGLPGYLSLQDGTWYLPQWLFDFLGIRYDMVGATRLQVVHVFLAGLGTWFLCRSLGCSPLASMLAATAAVFSGSFFSNAQHVDIVRGAAMFPWMMLATDWCVKKKSAISIALLALLTWQFLVGAYPGEIVAAAYCLPLCVAVRLFSVPRSEWARGLACLTFAASLAIGMSAVKFLPVAMDLSNIRQSAAQVSQVDIGVLSTVLFDFDVEYLPNDVTMRDLFIALPVLVLAPLGAGHSIAGRFGLVLCLVAALFILDPLGLASKLPLFNVSRFHLADFRPALHLGMCLLAAQAFDTLRAKLRLNQALALAAVSVVLLSSLMLLGSQLGVERKELALVGITSGVTGILAALLWWGRDRLVWTTVVGVCLVLLTAWSGVRHVERNARVWKVPRTDSAEIAQYGAPLSQLIGKDRYDALTNRPARLVFSDLPADRAQLYDPRYGRGWVGERFAAFGYSDLKGAKTYQHFYDGAKQPDGTLVRQQIEWLLRPSGLILDTSSMEKTLLVARECDFQVCASSASADTRIRPQLFLENGEVWEVNSRAPIRVTQNETWYPGWRSRLCEGGQCRSGPVAQDSEGLRTWSLPSGRYTFVSYYRPPGWTQARFVTLAAAFTIFLLLLLHVAKRFKLIKSSRPLTSP